MPRYWKKTMGHTFPTPSTNLLTHLLAIVLIKIYELHKLGYLFFCNRFPWKSCLRFSCSYISWPCFSVRSVIVFRAITPVNMVRSSCLSVCCSVISVGSSGITVYNFFITCHFHSRPIYPRCKQGRSKNLNVQHTWHLLSLSSSVSKILKITLSTREQA